MRARAQAKSDWPPSPRNRVFEPALPSTSSRARGLPTKPTLVLDRAGGLKVLKVIQIYNVLVPAFVWRDGDAGVLER